MNREQLCHQRDQLETQLSQLMATRDVFIGNPPTVSGATVAGALNAVCGVLSSIVGAIDDFLEMIDDGNTQDSGDLDSPDAQRWANPPDEEPAP